VKVSAGDVSEVNYTLSDMASDTVGLIEELGYSSVHVVGHSMGGMIAQRMAIEFPDRVRSLTLFGTKPMDGETGQSSPEFLANVMAPPAKTQEKRWEVALDGYRLCVAPAPVDEAQLLAFFRAQVERAPNPKMQCLVAVAASTMNGMSASPSHVEQVRALKVPTLVIHGSGDLVIAADGGKRLAQLIPDARLLLIDGLGHFPLGEDRWAVIADAVVTHITRHLRRDCT